MKRKYNGLIAIVIIGVILLPTAIYAIYPSQIPGGIHNARVRGFASDFSIPDAAVMKKIYSLDKEMVDIANPNASRSAVDRDIRFWRYSDQNYHRYTATRQSQKNIDARIAHTLTFTFASNEKKFCIIDGSFYAQGAELPDGEKIVEIETGRVQVKKGKTIQWISLSESTKWGEMEKKPHQPKSP